MKSSRRVANAIILVAVMLVGTTARVGVGGQGATPDVATVVLGFNPILMDEECSVDCTHTIDGETGPCVSDWPPSHHIAESAKNEGGTVPPGWHHELRDGTHDEECIIGSCTGGFTWQGQYIPAKHPACVVGSDEELPGALQTLAVSASEGDVPAALKAAAVLQGRLELAEAGMAL